MKSDKANQTKLFQAVMQEHTRKWKTSGRWTPKHARKRSKPKAVGAFEVLGRQRFNTVVCNRPFYSCWLSDLASE